MSALGLPDLGTLLALLLAGAVAVAGWFVKLWQSAKKREAETKRRLENAENHRRRESESRKKAEEERKKTEVEIDRIRKEVENGGTHHFESDR